MRRVPYCMETVSYICRAYDAPVFMLVTPSSKFTTAKALVDYARSNPGRINYATVGPGSLPHLAALDLDRKSVVWGKSVSVRVDLGGRRIMKKQIYVENSSTDETQHIIQTKQNRMKIK